MDVPGGGTVGNHRHRQGGRMGGIVQNLHVEHGGQAAEPLRTDAERVDALKYFQAQLFQLGFRSPRNQLADVDGFHQRFLRQQHGLLGAAADAHSQHAGRTPACTHVGHHLEHPVGHRVRWVQHGEQGLVFRAPAFRSHGDLDLVSRRELDVDDRRRVVAGIGSLERRIGHDGGAQLVAGIEVGATHTFVDHGFNGLRCLPAHAHAHFHEHHHDAGVLADRPVTLRAHARIGENLRDGIAGRGTLFHLVRATHGANEIRRVVVGDVLQGVGDAGNDIGFADQAHVQSYRIAYNRRKSEFRLRSVLALLFGICGCAATAVFAAAAPATPALMTAPTLPLHECRLEHPLRLASIAARCGVLTVPEDRSRPGGATIDLSVAVVPALNRRAAAAPLFLLAGGPGQSATSMYTSLAAAFARVNRNHDIVLVDQRGTGKSSPLTCDYPDDWQATSDLLPALRQATLACLRKYGDRVRFYTSSAAVADLAAVRESLEMPGIDLYGSSYGTRVAQLYMRRYPRSVHAVILDGVTYPEQAIGPETPLDGQRALDLIVKRCGDSPDCAAAYPELQQDLDGLRRQFGPQKSMLTIDDPNSGLPLKIEFNRNMLNASLRFLSYSASQAALLPTLIHRAAEGSLAPLAAQTIMT